jgi:hypothetical protein
MCLVCELPHSRYTSHESYDYSTIYRSHAVCHSTVVAVRCRVTAVRTSFSRLRRFVRQVSRVSRFLKPSCVDRQTVALCLSLAGVPLMCGVFCLKVIEGLLSSRLVRMLNIEPAGMLVAWFDMALSFPDSSMFLWRCSISQTVYMCGTHPVQDASLEAAVMKQPSAWCT